MVAFSQQNDQLVIAGFPPNGMSFEEMQHAYNDFSQSLTSSVGKVMLDMAGVGAADYSTLTFIISCSDLCVKRKTAIGFLNLEDEELKQALQKIGYDEAGNYKPKEFREVKPTSVFITAGEAASKFVEDGKKFITFIGDVFQSISYLVTHPWKLNIKEILFYMDKSGADAIPIVVMICFLVGLILAFQGLAQLGKFGLEAYTADLVGLSVVRELGPLMVGMICIGRAGSAFAAELGTMKVNEEIDAMNTMALKPSRFLVIPKIIALLVSMPMLVVIGDVAGIVGGIVIGVSLTDISLIEYCNRTVQSLVPANVLESVVKGFVFAFIIAGVGCFRGFEADNDAKGVGNATTSSVVTGIFLVIIADAAITFIFPQFLAIFGVKY